MWQIFYHPKVEEDLKYLGNHEANRVLKAIENRIAYDEPDKIGQKLSHELRGYQRLRVGDLRIVFKVFKKEIKVLVVAVGPRKDDYVYERAVGRV